MGKQCSNNTLSQGKGGYPLVSLLTVFFFFSSISSSQICGLYYQWDSCDNRVLFFIQIKKILYQTFLKIWIYSDYASPH